MTAWQSESARNVPTLESLVHTELSRHRVEAGVAASFLRMGLRLMELFICDGNQIRNLILMELV